MLVVDDELLQRVAALEKKVAMLEGQPDSDWYDIDEICVKYRLPKNNIKSRKWRLQNDFPTYQDSAYSRVSFRGKEVEQWMNDRLGGRKCG